jgi:single-strand DNA-binding protein
MDINEWVGAGRLTRDPELSYTKNQTSVCNFSIASNGMKEGEVSFFDVTAWSKTADNVAKFLKKGSQCIIEGRLHQDRFQDKDGQNRSKVKIIARIVQFIGGKSDAAAGGQQQQQYTGQQQGQPPDDIPIPEPEWNNGAINEGDVPF